MKAMAREREKEIISYLLAEWRKPMRLTTVAQGMAALGLPADDDLRWRTGRRLQRLWRTLLVDPERYERTRFALGVSFDRARFEQFLEQARDWNPVSYILTEDEKLVARYILLVRAQETRFPSMEQIAEVMGKSRDFIKTCLTMLERIGFLSLTKDTSPSYRLAIRHRRFLKGLGFFFHTVTLAGGERFNVPCAIDYLLLVSRLHRDEQVTLDDSCAHCVERIHITIAGGQVTEAIPEEPIVYRGGT